MTPRRFDGFSSESVAETKSRKKGEAVLPLRPSLRYSGRRLNLAPRGAARFAPRLLLSGRPPAAQPETLASRPRCLRPTGASSRSSATGTPQRSQQTVRRGRISCSEVSHEGVCAAPQQRAASSPARVHLIVRAALDVCALMPSHPRARAEDLISAVEFDGTGEYLATGDRGGRVVIFEASTVAQKRLAGQGQGQVCTRTRAPGTKAAATRARLRVRV